MQFALYLFKREKGFRDFLDICRSVIAGILCVAVSVYLGLASVSINVAPFPETLGGWLGIIPKIASFFIKGVQDLLVVGLSIALMGRSIRLYIERDSRLLRNIALIVTVAWFRWILESTANVIIYYYNKSSPVIGITDPIFSNFLFTIIVGILIGIAYIINRSARGFFKKKQDEPDEL